ncbi:hypothetical protein GCM10028793_04970 [Nocardiopsis oceani]
MPSPTQAPFSRDRLPAGVEPPGAQDPEALGRYRVVGRIGAGGMGAVYAGIDDTGGCAAVKVVHPQYAADPEFRARFAREVDLVSRVRGTCTPAFLGSDVRSDTPWLATDYVSGHTLRQHVGREGPLTGGLLTALAVGLAEALAAIHAQGVVHRDFKPGNVILAPDGPKVLDFGIARAAEGTAFTETGGVLGTPGWIAPEQYEGLEATGSSDMFAWAVTVLYAATGRDPFGKGAVDVIAYRTRNEEPDLSDVPDMLRPLLERALTKDPGARPTALEALAELTGAWSATRVDPAGQAHPTEVVPGLLATEWRGISAPAQRKVRSGRGRGWAVVLTAVLGVVLLAASGLYWVTGERLQGGAAAGADPADGGQGADEQDAGGESAPDGDEGGGEAEADLLRVEADPEDGAAVAAEALDLFDEAESFELYRRESLASVHDSLTMHRYTAEPQAARHSIRLAGPGEVQTLWLGEDLDDVLERSALRGAGFDETPGPYSRDVDEGGEEQDPWAFLDDIALLTGDGAEITYHGESAVALGDTSWPEAEFDIALEAGTGHHYSGTYTKVREEWEEDAGAEFVLTFDLWVGEDGRLQSFQDFEETGDALHVEGDVEEGQAHTSTETVVVHYDEPVEIEVPDEAEID